MEAESCCSTYLLPGEQVDSVCCGVARTLRRTHTGDQWIYWRRWAHDCPDAHAQPPGALSGTDALVTRAAHICSECLWHACTRPPISPNIAVSPWHTTTGVVAAGRWFSYRGGVANRRGRCGRKIVCILNYTSQWATLKHWLLTLK